MSIISVIVPIYKVSDYLPKCIDSIIKQTYSDLEIILVDDGSPDDCPKICDKYAEEDNRIKVIHKPNGGLSDARNAGLDIATGEYIGFIDSDDYIDEHMYEDMLSAIEKDDADLCICGYDRVDDDGKIKSSAHYKNALLSQKEAYEMLVQGNVYFIISCNKLYKREIFDNLRFKIGRTHEDEFIMHHVYGECSKIVTLEKSYYNYLVRESSIIGSVKGNIKHFDAVDAYLDRMEFFHLTNEKTFAARLMPITMNQYQNVKHTIGINGPDFKRRSKQARNHLRSNIKLIDSSCLSFADRVGVILFYANERVYFAWNAILNCMRRYKDKRKTNNKG